MAHVPPYYYNNFSENQQQQSGSYPRFTDPFMSAYASGNISSSNSTVSPYSPNNYQMGFSHSTSSPLHSNSLAAFNGQVANPPMNCPSPNIADHRNLMFRNRNLNSNNIQVPMKEANNNCDKKSPSDELDEHLNELPMESLLYLTQQEGQIINETEVEDMPGSNISNVNLSIPQRKNDQNSSVYSPHSDNLYTDNDRDDDDSGSCISSSTVYSLTSTPEAVAPNQALANNYDLSNHSSPSPLSVSNCMSSPYDSSSLSDNITPSHPFSQSHNPRNPVNFGNTFSNPHGPNMPNVVNNFPTFNDHMKSPSTSNHTLDYPHLNPDYHNKTSNRDIAGNFKDLFSSSPNTMINQRNNEPRHMKKKQKVLKKDLKSDLGPRSSKVSKVKDTTLCTDGQNSLKKGYISPGEESLRMLDDIDRRLNEIADENTVNSTEDLSMKFPSSNDHKSTKNTEKVSTKVIPPRKRMRCPRGMSLEIKPCEVCGDNAKNMHFGGLVCDSCKAFFRRSVQSQTWDQFKCEKEENCVITKANRRSCQYCRFCKCERVGMKQEWVMPESGRMNLLKNRLARTRQVQEEKEKEVVYGDLPRNLGQEDAVAINRLLTTLHVTFATMPYPKVCIGDDIDALSNIFVFLCKRFGMYFLKITEDTDICREDKKLLLKNGIAMSLYINGAHMYDPEMRAWPANSTHESVKVPSVTLDTLQKLANIPDAFATIMKFYENYESDLKDHVVAVLMYLIAFFAGDDPNFLDLSCIKAVQNKYIEYLKRYLIARDGYNSANAIFMKMMNGLNFVKDILKFHALVDIKPTIDHTNLSLYSPNSITQSIGNLIHQIQLSIDSAFPPYSSVFNDEEKESLGIFKNAITMRRRKENNHIMPHHPDTIAIFGSITRTDMLITEPLQNMIEWQEKIDSQSSTSGMTTSNDSIAVIQGNQIDFETETKPDVTSNDSFLFPLNNPILDKTEKEESFMDSQEVDVDAVCDILKQLSHTDDVKVFSILKENIPVDLLEKFSHSLSQDVQ